MVIKLVKINIRKRVSESTGTRSPRLVRFRHQIVYFLLKPPIQLFLRAAFNFRPVRYKSENDKQPYFILSNHNGSLDPLMLAQSFKMPIYFVASDHLFRLGLISKILVWLVSPIPIVKSQIDLHAMRQILKVRQENGTTCLFPSGNRSFTGPEMTIPQATGKLVKHLRCKVLLYRFDGGYLTSPRWARSPRRGRLTGKVVREFSVDELKDMTVDQINQIIFQELDANPYRLSKNDSLSFKGRNLAEYLERILFVCPSCYRLDSMRSSGSLLKCECGFKVEYEANGWFKATDPECIDIVNQLPNTEAFDKFQKDYLASQFANPVIIEKYSAVPIFEDCGEILTQTMRASHSTVRLIGKIALYSDRLVISNSDETLIFSLDQIGRFSVHGPQVLQFFDSHNGIVYELKSKIPRSAYKYVAATDLLRQITDRNK
jgi:1-acyl-sn-glycerol-3-phosphate acyltransferase